MVWSVKYRRKILNQEIEEYLQKLVQQIAEDKGFTVHCQGRHPIMNLERDVEWDSVIPVRIFWDLCI